MYSAVGYNHTWARCPSQSIGILYSIHVLATASAYVFVPLHAASYAYFTRKHGGDIGIFHSPQRRLGLRRSARYAHSFVSTWPSFIILLRSITLHSNCFSWEWQQSALSYHTTCNSDYKGYSTSGHSLNMHWHLNPTFSSVESSLVWPLSGAVHHTYGLRMLFGSSQDRVCHPIPSEELHTMQGKLHKSYRYCICRAR